MRLDNYQEIIGTITSIKQSEGIIHVIFTIKTTIDLPASIISVEELQKLLGKQVGIFNNAGDYKISIIQGNNETIKKTSVFSLEKNNHIKNLNKSKKTTIQIGGNRT